MAEHVENEARYIDINKVTIPIGFFNQDLNVPKLLDWLNSQHTADVAEVKHGEWERKFDEMGIDRGYKCSACKNYVYQMTYEPYVFCPHCGAKMTSNGDTESGAKVMLRLCGTEYKYCDGICKNCNEPEYHATNRL